MVDYDLQSRDWELRERVRNREEGRKGDPAILMHMLL